MLQFSAMSINKRTKKEKQAIRKLMQILENDGLSVELGDVNARGKLSFGDLALKYKKRKYPINVKRQENIPNTRLEKEKADSDLLLFRKNRENWKVYMDLDDLILLLLNNRS